MAKQIPKIVVLCGSSRFTDVMAVCGWLIERDEKAIVTGLHLLPIWYPGIKDIPDHIAEHEGCSDEMDELHLRKIDIASEIFIVNFDNYIGESTKKEIEYAKIKNINFRWYTCDPVGVEVEKMIKGFLDAKAKK